MKKTLKLTSMALTIVIMLSVLTCYASAATTSLDMSSASFSKKWEKTTHFYVSLDGNPLIEVGSMIWGYDTFLINEDYCKTRGWANNKSTAKLKRVGYDTNFLSGQTANTTYFSEIEKTHKNNCSGVVYRITLSGDYNNHEITRTTV